MNYGKSKDEERLEQAKSEKEIAESVLDAAEKALEFIASDEWARYKEIQSLYEQISPKLDEIKERVKGLPGNPRENSIFRMKQAAEFLADVIRDALEKTRAQLEAMSPRAWQVYKMAHQTAREKRSEVEKLEEIVRIQRAAKH